MKTLKVLTWLVTALFVIIVAVFWMGSKLWWGYVGIEGAEITLTSGTILRGHYTIDPITESHRIEDENGSVTVFHPDAILVVVYGAGGGAEE